MTESSNIYTYGPKLRFLLNKYIFNTRLNELIELIKEETKADIVSVDYISHKFTLSRDKSLDDNILIPYICTIVCKFLSKYKLDIEIAIDTLDREDEKECVKSILNDILIGLHINMMMNIMNLSTTKDKTVIMIQL